MGQKGQRLGQWSKQSRWFNTTQLLLMSSFVACSGVKSCFEPGGVADPVQIGDVFGSDVGKFVPCGSEDIECLGQTKNATKVFCNCKCTSPCS